MTTVTTACDSDPCGPCPDVKPAQDDINVIPNNCSVQPPWREIPIEALDEDEYPADAAHRDSGRERADYIQTMAHRPRLVEATPRRVGALRRMPRQARWRTGACLVALALAVSACGADDGSDADTTQDLLEQLEGRPLSPAEIAERNEVADLLCGLDDTVLVAVWDELQPSDFEFQDIVFTSTCPERLPVYAEHTGRFVVGEPEG